MTESAEQYYGRTLGRMPSEMALLREHAPDFLDGYLRCREAIVGDAPDGLDTKTQELLFVVLDLAYDNEMGARLHIDAALRAGLPLRSLLEGLLLTALVGGVATWARLGADLYAYALERAEALETE